MPNSALLLRLLFWSRAAAASACLVFLLHGFSTPALAGDGQAPPMVRIPVLYATDRNREGNSYGPNRKYIVDCLHDLYYGTAYVPVPNEKSRQADPTFDRLGWKGIEKTRERVSEKSMIEADDPEHEKQKFFAALGDSLDRSGGDRLCLFVHGGADPFEDSCLDAAMLAYYMECPTVIYSWPSVGKLKKYRVDEGNCEWSQEHFDLFCEDLQKFSEKHPVRVTLVAHSMGNRLLARAVKVLYHTNYISDIAMVSPDIDAETFRHYVMGYRSRGRKARLYFSTNDKVLPYTQMLYGGYYRLGEGIGSVLATLSGGRTGARQAEAPAADDTSAARLSPVRRELLRNKRRLEKIDFTAVDRGVIGHNFPFALVASMSRFDRPGDGLTLIPEKAGQGNLLARYARWKGDLGPDHDKSAGFAFRVVPADHAEEILRKEKAALSK